MMHSRNFPSSMPKVIELLQTFVADVGDCEPGSFLTTSQVLRPVLNEKLLGKIFSSCGILFTVYLGHRQRLKG
jgi:hypothetical protein